MFGNSIAVLSLIFSMTACAQPHYETIQSQSQTNGSEIADCSIRFIHSQNCVSWRWEKLPTESAPGALSFKIYRINAFDQSAVEVDPLSPPFVTLWMPDMGHGSSPTHVSRMDIGTYLAENVFFVMPGQWEIRFQLKDQGVVNDEAIVAITF